MLESLLEQTCSNRTIANKGLPTLFLSNKASRKATERAMYPHSATLSQSESRTLQMYMMASVTSSSVSGPFDETMAVSEVVTTVSWSVV